MERFIIPPNATRRQIVTLIPARPCDRLFQTGSIANVRRRLFSGFTDLLVPVRQQSFRQLQSFCRVHPNPVIISQPAFSLLGERKGVKKAISCSQQSHINLLLKYLDYVNTSTILWNQIQYFIQSRWTYSYNPLSSMRFDIYRPFHNDPILLSQTDWTNAMTRRPNS